MKYEFDAELKYAEVGKSGGAYVLFPYDVIECFDTKGQIKVKCTFDGEPYRGSLVNMGEGHCVGVLKAIKEKIGKDHGEIIHVTLEKDMEERVIEVPEDLLKVIEETGKKGFFQGLSATNKKLYVIHVTSAKQEKTRLARLEACREYLTKEIKNLNAKK